MPAALKESITKAAKSSPLSSTQIRWDIPKNWIWVRAGDIALIVGGGTPKASEKSNFTTSGNGIGWITPADLTGYKLDTIEHGRRDLTERGVAVSGAQILPPGTVLLSTRAPIGYSVVSTAPLSTNQGFKNLVLRGGVSPFYIRYYFIASRSYLNSLGSGLTFAELSSRKIAEIPIPLPPLAEQHRIVARLRALEARSRKAHAHLAELPTQLAQTRQSLLSAAFSGTLTADWRSAQRKSSGREWKRRLVRTRQSDWETHEKARREKEGVHSDDNAWKEKYRQPKPIAIIPPKGIPASWTYVSAETCAWEITVGYVGPMKFEYVKSGVPFLRSQNVRENRFDPTEIVHIRPSFHKIIQKSSLHSGDVVIVRTGVPGTSCVIPSEIKEANCSDLVIARPVSIIIPQYLSFYVNSPMAREQVFNLQVGVAQQHFNVGAMSQLGVPVAPEAEQREIVLRLEAALARLDTAAKAHVAAITDLERLEHAFLARAFSGRLVSQKPTDEPASILLNRISLEPAPIIMKKPRSKSIAPKESMRAIIAQLPAKGFTFEQLSEHVSMDYETLRDEIFEMLGEQHPILRQEFDTKTRCIHFVRN